MQIPLKSNKEKQAEESSAPSFFLKEEIYKKSARARGESVALALFLGRNEHRFLTLQNNCLVSDLTPPPPRLALLAC